jgi:SHS2 domain-containing protein
MGRAAVVNQAAHHTFEEHVGELRVRVDAASLAGVFEEAAVVLCELAAGADLEPAPETERVSLQATGREALLVDWLNEILYRSDSRKRVYPRARVERVDDRTLVATLEAAEPRAIHTEVKAATMHDLFVGEAGGGWTARFVLDV